MPLVPRKLFVSATDAAGGFTGRGVVSVKRALEVMEDFADAGEGERAVFMVLSDHDGRVELRNRVDGAFVAVVTARAARKAALGGLLPARDPVVWRIDTLDREEAGRIVTALYRLSGSGFRAQVSRELTA